jgi:histidine ammonia-lyase
MIMTEYSFHPGHPLTLDVIRKIFTEKQSVALSDEAQAGILKSRDYLDRKLASGDDAVYGINTGFGALCNEVIDAGKLGSLQRNLLLSHACGMGAEVDSGVVKIMLLLKIQGLSQGYSGVHLSTVRRLADFYNKGIYPVIFAQGSLGASGDLAPLSHLALPLIGEGEVRMNGERMPAAEALKKVGLAPLELSSKEGLALINGTQFMSAHLTWILLRAFHLFDYSLCIAGMSADAFDARPEPFDDLTHLVRPYHGQRIVAQQFRNMLEGSTIMARPKTHVQDPYSFRCIPQVHGASLDALHYARQVLETEINSVTDNPLIFADEDRIISGGNFHGQPLALVLDFAAIAIAEIASMSERRTYKLLSGQRGLPPFLAPAAGLNSGYMIPQYAAASIVSQNKQLCTPASVDTIDSSNGQEDHVSMGANAATKCLQVVENLQSVLAIEWMTAAQGLELRRPLRSSTKIENLFSRLRQEVPFAAEDISMSRYIPLARNLMNGFIPAG